MALKWYQQAKGRACVIGLDGVPCSMVRKFVDAGVMPNLGRIVGEGTLRDMTVSLPEISSVSWSTFMTGKNPGEHGIFGFTDLHEGTYKTSFPSFRELKCPTIWDTMGEAKMRSVVINQPATYPARPIHGALVSGFVAIHLDKSIFPAKYLRTAKDLGYEIDLDAGEVRDDPEKLFAKLSSQLEGRKKLMDALWDEEKWNLMQVVVTGTDRLHHFLMDAYEDESHPQHEAFLNYYREVDAFIGHVVERFDKEDDRDNLFLLSDHGFCQTHNEVYINTVLTQHGFLKMQSPDARDLMEISEQSTAFALDPARIYIHERGRFPRGSVAEADVPRVKDEIRAVFNKLEHNGQKVIRHIFDGDDVYSGPHANRGPDLLLVPHNGFDLKGRLGSDVPVGDRRLQGMHTWDDAFFVTRRRDLVPDNESFTLVDIPGKILKSLNVS